MSLSSAANLSQRVRDSVIDLTLPDLNISVSRFYPFRRKYAAGKERWYEKISLSYTGHVSNSISTKEDKLLDSRLNRDWKNGMQHNIPISASFSLFNAINLTTSFNFTDRMYLSKEKKSWVVNDRTGEGYEKTHTLFGLYNVYNWSASVSANTKLYGMFIPSRKLFGDKIQAIRHVFTPSVSFNFAPDFGDESYGYWNTYQRTLEDGKVETVRYSPYSNSLFGVPGSGKTGAVMFQMSNNLEMKIKSDKDTTGFKKISLIDELGASISYNMAAKEHNWSDLNMNLRLKWWKSYTFSLSAVFKTYAVAQKEDGTVVETNRTQWSLGHFGRFQGMSQNISYTLNPEKLKKLFGGGDDKKKKDTDDADDDDDTGLDSNIDPVMAKGQKAVEDKPGKAETDDDGYMLFSMPWSLTFSYGVTMREDAQNFKKYNQTVLYDNKKCEAGYYGYKFTQNLNFSGNVRLSEGWNISFSSGYDFDYKKLSLTTASLSRDLHCFSMSCSVVLAPYTSYNFSFRCNAATLTDALKYDKRSGYSNNVNWY